MKKNMGLVDRSVRTVLAVIIAILYFTNQISGIAAIVLGLFAVVFLVTSFMSFCPLYAPFKLSTLKKSDKA
jgi:Na+(H+)/acetate symporter ActP